MTEWVMTATTIYCEAVEEEVTLMINRDGTARCTSHRKFAEATGEAARQINARAKRYGKKLACEGLECRRITEYRERLLASEGGEARD